MKVVERDFEHRIRQHDMQFGVMPRKGTADAIFVVSQLR